MVLLVIVREVPLSGGGEGDDFNGEGGGTAERTTDG